jgi:hypothetical protein
MFVLRPKVLDHTRVDSMRLISPIGRKTHHLDLIGFNSLLFHISYLDSVEQSTLFTACKISK